MVGKGERIRPGQTVIVEGLNGPNRRLLERLEDLFRQTMISIHAHAPDRHPGAPEDMRGIRFHIEGAPKGACSGGDAKASTIDQSYSSTGDGEW